MKNKTKEQLIKELKECHQRIAELEAADTERIKAEEALKAANQQLDASNQQAWASEQKIREKEAEAQEARQYAESIVETVREPLLVLDANLRIISANSSFYKTFQVTHEETTGQFIYDLGNHQWDITVLRELLEKILPKNTIVNDYIIEHDFMIIGRKTMQLNARRIYREANKTQMILLAIEDITERKQAEEVIKKYTSQLEAVNKELEAFSYSVSHDLRAPLRAIDGFSKILLEDYYDKLNTEGKRKINVVRSNTEKMAQLIDDLLKFSRLGRYDLHFSEINIQKLVEEVFKELKATNPERKLQLKIKKPPNSQGDRSLIREVCVNLLDNAIKFTGPGENAIIEVGGRVEGNECIYYVKDNGVGFDMKYVDKLFGVFQRLHSMEEFEGTGVGLAIIQRIIHRHGGRVWAEGKINEGATFYFTLPSGEL